MSAMLRETVDLADKLEAYGFRCEGGPLVNCTDWQAFKRLVLRHYHKNRHDGTDICEVCGHDLRHSVHLLVNAATPPASPAGRK